MIEVIAITIFQTISKLFQDDQIPFQKSVSDLSNSTNYMRGKKSGLEKRL